VSPLWRDQVQALLTPTDLTLVRFSRGMRPKAVVKRVVPVTEDRTSSMPNWTGALLTLCQALPAKEWADTDLSVILSNHFVRHQVIPWRDELRDQSELIEFSRQSMRNTYGRQAAQWSIELSLDRAGQPYVASAIDRLLLDELKAVTTAQGMRLVSVRPLLMEAFNWAKEWLTSSYQWLVIVEDGMICASLVGKGRWVVVRSLRARSDWPSEVVAMLEREQFVVDEAEAAQTVLLHVVNGQQMELPANQWTVRHLHQSPVNRAGVSVLSCAL
jgi:hypothetical protein